MATGIQEAYSSMVFRAFMVNKKGSFVEQVYERVVAFYLVKIFLRRSSSPLLATMFVAKSLFWVLLLRPKSGLSPMYERFDPHL